MRRVRDVHWSIPGGGRRFGRGLLSELRLQPLLRALRPHLRAAGPLWLSALRTERILRAEPRLRDQRHPPRKHHDPVSPAPERDAAAVVTSMHSVWRIPLTQEAPMRFGTVLPLVVMVFLSSAGWPPSAAAGYWGSSYGWRECWVTMSGLGVCAPAATYRLKASPS